MNLIDAKVIEGKLYLLIQKGSGNLLAVETHLEDLDIGLGLSQSVLDSMYRPDIVVQPHIRGSAYLRISDAKTVPKDWVERIQTKALAEPPKQLSGPEES